LRIIDKIAPRSTGHRERDGQRGIAREGDDLRRIDEDRDDAPERRDATGMIGCTP